MRNKGYVRYRINTFTHKISNISTKISSKNDYLFLISQKLELPGQCRVEFYSPDNLHITTPAEYTVLGLHQYQIFRDKIEITISNHPDPDKIDCTLEFLRITPEPQ